MNKLPIISLGVAILAVILALFLRPANTPTQFSGATFAATFGESQATSTNIVVNLNSKTIITADGRTSFWSVCNLSTSTVYLSFTNPATTTQGILLNPQSSSTPPCYQMNYPSIDNGNIYAVGAATATLSVATGRAL